MQKTDDVGSKFNAEVTNKDFAPGETWEVKFNTGTTPGEGSFSMAEKGGGPCMRHCDVVDSAGKVIRHQDGMGITFYYRTQDTETGANKRHAKLAPNTVYTARFTTDQPSGAICTFYPPRAKVGH